MKAILWTKYGPPEVLQLGDVEKPTPKKNEVLIRIQATTVTAGDCEMRQLKFPFGLKYLLRFFNGIWKPKRITILGQELSGRIDEIGEEVTKFKVGDDIFASTNFFMGAYAEYKCLPEDGVIALKPENLPYKKAAAIPLGGTNSLHFLKSANIQPGDKVLVNGAGGSIGTIGVQLAKYWGAEVTAVDSKEKLEMLRSIGADYVIDFMQEDFTKNEKIYDVIFDIVGKARISDCMRSLSEEGILLLGNISTPILLQAKWNSWRSKKRIVTSTADPTSEDLMQLKDLIEDGILKIIVDRSFQLEDMVEAHRYVESGKKIGNVVIDINESPLAE